MNKDKILAFFRNQYSRIRELIKRDKRFIFILIPALLLPILAVCVIITSFSLLVLNLGKKTATNRPVYVTFEEYRTNIRRISEHLKDDDNDSGLDPDSFSREALKGEEFLKVVDNDYKDLDKFLNSKTSSKFNNYKKYLSAYLSKSKEISEIERNIVTIYFSYIEPLKISEDLSNKLPSFYSYDDLEKYVKSLEDGINKEEEIINMLQKVQVEGDVKAIHEVTINKFKIEQDYLKKVKNSVLSKDDSDLFDIDVQYRKSQQENAKEFSRLNDNIKDKVNKINEELDLLEEKLDSETNKLGIYKK